MTDLLAVLAEMRDGQTCIDLNRKFNELNDAVLSTLGAGEMVIKLKLEPAEVAVGGKVLRLSIKHDVKLKVPEIKQGPSTFFVCEDGTLTRQNPAQEAMFDGAEVNRG